MILTFDKAIYNLPSNDIILKNLDKVQLASKGNGIYKLAVFNIIALHSILAVWITAYVYGMACAAIISSCLYSYNFINI